MGNKCFQKEEPQKVESRSLPTQPDVNQITGESKDLILVPQKIIQSYEKDVIFSALKKNSLFKDLTEIDLEEIQQALKYCVVNAKKFIFHQNSYGSLFYIIHSGSVEVVVDSKRKGILAKDSCFGELALLSDSIRKASIRTLEKSSFWVLSREMFLSTVKKIMMRKIDSLRLNLSKISLFSTLNEISKETLAASAIIRKYYDDDLIIREGEKGDFLFVLLSGVVKFVRQGQEIALIKEEGEVFGENALLTGSIRTASCYSHGASEVMAINKQNLENTLGSAYKDVLLRCIAKLAIQTNPDLSFLNRLHISSITDNIKFFEYKDQETALKEGFINEYLGIICVGGVQSERKQDEKVGSYQIIGFFNETKATQKAGNYLADGPTIIGKIKYKAIQNIIGVNILSLVKYLDTLKFLSKVSLFKYLSLESLKKVSEAVKVVKFSKDTVIFMEEEPSESVFVVRSGLVNIIKDEKLLRLISPTESFGERCLFERTRTASAVSYKDSELLEINKQVLLLLPEKKFLKTEIDRKKCYQSEIDLQSVHVKFKYPHSIDCRSYFNVKNIENNAIFDLTVIPKTSLKNVSECEDLVREKQLQIMLDHHLVQKLVTAGDKSSCLLFITEHIPGNFLKYFLPTTEDYTKILVVFICSVLDYLHAKKIIYRDLNSSNILISSKGFPYFFHFKNSKIVQDRTYSKVGNYFYMSREMILARGYCRLVDYWALGVLIHEMLYGKLPFGMEYQDDALTAFEKILNNDVEVDTLRFESANKVIRNLLSSTSLRFDSEKIRKSTWMRNFEWETIIMLNSNSPQFPNLIFPQVQTEKVDMDLYSFLKVRNRQNMKKVNVSIHVRDFDWFNYF